MLNGGRVYVVIYSTKEIDTASNVIVRMCCSWSKAKKVLSLLMLVLGHEHMGGETILCIW